MNEMKTQVALLKTMVQTLKDLRDSCSTITEEYRNLIFGPDGEQKEIDPQEFMRIQAKGAVVIMDATCVSTDATLGQLVQLVAEMEADLEEGDLDD
jgi:hypothetical protein